MAVAEAFEGVPLRSIWCSTQRRARSTAAALARNRELSSVADPRFDEMDFGDWDGMSHRQIEEAYPREYSQWMAAVTEARPPGGETVDEVVKRAWAAFSDAALAPLTSSHSDSPGSGEAAGRSAKDSSFRPGSTDRSIAIVSHGGPIRLILTMLLAMPRGEYWRFRVDPASVTAVDVFDEGASVLVYSNFYPTDRLSSAGIERRQG